MPADSLHPQETESQSEEGPCEERPQQDRWQWSAGWACVELNKTMKWKIEYGNDTGSNDEGIWEWWTVTDGDKSFKCDDEADAKWLCDTLNASTPNAGTQRPGSPDVSLATETRKPGSLNRLVSEPSNFSLA